MCIYGWVEVYFSIPLSLAPTLTPTHTLSLARVRSLSLPSSLSPSLPRHVSLALSLSVHLSGKKVIHCPSALVKRDLLYVKKRPTICQKETYLMSKETYITWQKRHSLPVDTCRSRTALSVPAETGCGGGDTNTC